MEKYIFRNTHAIRCKYARVYYCYIMFLLKLSFFVVIHKEKSKRDFERSSRKYIFVYFTLRSFYKRKIPTLLLKLYMLATRAREFFTYVFFSIIFFVTCTKWSWSCTQEKGFDKEASVVYISRTTTKSEFEEWIQSLQQKYTYVKTCYWNCVYSWNSIFCV